MINIFDIVLRLTIWFLLTNDLSRANIVIGVAIAFILPSSSKVALKLKDWFKLLGQLLLTIPQAYKEALELILSRRPLEESIEAQAVSPLRASGLVFLDIFRITLTPKTIVLRRDPVKGYIIHRLERRSRQ